VTEMRFLSSRESDGPACQIGTPNSLRIRRSLFSNCALGAERVTNFTMLVDTGTAPPTFHVTATRPATDYPLIKLDELILSVNSSFHPADTFGCTYSRKDFPTILRYSS